MRRDELLKPDLLSEILLMGSGLAIVAALVIVAIAGCTRVVALQ